MKVSSAVIAIWIAADGNRVKGGARMGALTMNAVRAVMKNPLSGCSGRPLLKREKWRTPVIAGATLKDKASGVRGGDVAHPPTNPQKVESER
jgi:hypothetical protein